MINKHNTNHHHTSTDQVVALTTGYGSVLGWARQIERMEFAGTRVAVGSAP